MPNGISRTRLTRLVVRARRGDTQAVSQLISLGLPRAGELVEGLDEDLDYHRAETWDLEEPPEKAMAGEIDPEQTVGAFAELYRQQLRVTASLLAWLAAETDEEADFYGAKLYEHVRQLFFMCHNPQIRYAIVGGFREEVREDVDDYLQLIGEEAWGVVRAVTSEEIDFEDLPQGTGEVFQQFVQMAEDNDFQT